MPTRKQIAAIMAFAAATAAAALIRAQTPMDTSFTYQGRLTENGVAVGAPCDFEFVLFDSAAGTGQVGTTQSFNDLTVTNGLFNVALNFSGTAFNGDKRWLEIRVRPGTSTGSYTTLTPRREVKSSPVAGYALDSEKLGGLDPSEFIGPEGPPGPAGPEGGAGNGLPTQLVFRDADGHTHQLTFEGGVLTSYVMYP